MLLTLEVKRSNQTGQTWMNLSQVGSVSNKLHGLPDHLQGLMLFLAPF